jgi:tetratricopeptide (TPR) repeat protein
MEEFLKQLQLSDEAIRIYNKCFLKSPLTYNELYSLISDLSPDDFKKIVDELIDHDLIVQITPRKPEILVHYMILPPIKSILNYYLDFPSNLNNIQELIHTSMVNSLSRIFEESEVIEIDSIYNQFQDIFKDFSEDALIQKQDVEEIIADFEKFNETENKLSELKEMLPAIPQKIISVLLPQITNLLKELPKLKYKLIDKIKVIELKKKEGEVINIIEDLFKAEIQKKLEHLILNMKGSIQAEFKEIEAIIEETTLEPIETKIKDSFQYVNDFKLLYLNVISNFEAIMNKLQKIIVKKRENLEGNLQKAENLVLEKIDSIIHDSMNQVSGLSKLMESIIHQFEDKSVYSEKMSIDDLWLIKSKSKLLEEITNLMTNSKGEAILIIPKIEEFLNIIQFQNLPTNLRIKIASSDAHTNSLVKIFKEIKNLEFRTIQNENRIALKGDNNKIIICLVNKDSKDPLDNLIGIGSDFKPLITILTPIIEASWATASGETVPTKRKKKTAKIKAPSQKMPHIESVETQTTETTQDSFVSNIYPKPGDEVGMQINTAFNLLIQRLKTATGEEFSKELQKIADLILEKRGFSVTLHKIRSLINKYKEQLAPIISQKEKDKLFEEI